jgi:hypothetical protein
MMYVIDADGQLWRVDTNSGDLSDSVHVTRPQAEGMTWESRRLALHEVIIDPTDDELADLGDSQLTRFGLSRSLLRP